MRDDLCIDRIGNADLVLASAQAEVAHAFVIMGGEVESDRTTQQRLDDALHPLFLQLVGKLVEMHRPHSDEDFPGREDGVRGDRAATVSPWRVLEASSVAQGIHQPWLLGGLRTKAVASRGLEVLARLGRVLAEQLAESERSALTRLCMHGRRIGELEELRREPGRGLADGGRRRPQVPQVGLSSNRHPTEHQLPRPRVEGIPVNDRKGARGVEALATQHVTPNST